MIGGRTSRKLTAWVDNADFELGIQVLLDRACPRKQTTDTYSYELLTAHWTTSIAGGLTGRM